MVLINDVGDGGNGLLRRLCAQTCANTYVRRSTYNFLSYYARKLIILKDIICFDLF